MYVTHDEIAVALGRTAPASTTPEYKQWEMWADDAYLLIESHFESTETPIEDLDGAKLAYVIREAVVAQVRRPDDATQVAVSVDDGSVSRTYRSGSGRVRIRDEWWDLLDPDSGDSGKAFSVDTAPPGSAHLPWCSLEMGAAYCSCGVDIAGYPIYELDAYY